MLTKEHLHVLYQGSQTLTHLECMSCRTLSWHNQFNVTGSEPTARFGHSCTFHPRTNSLIIIGGCDGTDLLRNGDELREVICAFPNFFSNFFSNFFFFCS